MNFWTFLDRNGHGLFWLVVLGLMFGFGTCGDGQGCRLRCAPTVTVKNSVADGGAP